MAFPLINPAIAFLDASRNPLASGTIEFRNPNNDNFISSYPTAADADARTNANANPITLNAKGEASSGLFLEDDVQYKITLRNIWPDPETQGSVVWTRDNIRCPTRLLTLYGKTAQTLTDAGAVSLTESTTFIVTTTTSALTLANGTENQKKLIVMKTDGGDATLTPSNIGIGTNIVFDDVDDSADLVFMNGKWHMIGGTATLTGNASLANIVEDTTPQLGGDLDAQGNNITSGGVVFLNEQSAADADVTADGQFWVRTETPNTAMFTDDAGTDHELAYNDFTQISEDTSDTIDGKYPGNVYFKDGTSAITLTLEGSSSTTFPVKSVCQIINANATGAISVTEGTGDTLFILTGSAVTDTTGTATIAGGGYATLYREAAGTWYIMGAGIT